MTSLTLSTDEALNDLLTEIHSKLPSTDPLQKIRAKAWERFLTLGLPAKNNEVFRYIKLRQFYAQTFAQAEPVNVSKHILASHVLPECRNAVLVFVNGFYQPSLSNISGISKKIVISSLDEAMKTYGSFLNNQWTASLKDENDPFVALNAALHQAGIFIYIPPRTIEEQPIQILNVIQTDKSILVMPRVNLFAGMQSQANFVSSIANLSGEHCCMVQAADIAVEDGARIQYVQDASDVPATLWLFDGLRATLKRDSRLETVCASTGSATVRHDYNTVLAGENGEVALNGVWMLSGKLENHVHVLINHQAPHCRSMQLFKGALNDTSKSSFEGKIFVQQAAQKTDAFQLNNNLLLSDYAHADSKPNLEIFADDVKASHGATVGQLDAEQLFYMKTRGFSEADAKNMLVYSYCKEVIDRINITSMVEKLSSRAKRYLS